LQRGFLRLSFKSSTFLIPNPLPKNSPSPSCLASAVEYFLPLKTIFAPLLILFFHPLLGNSLPNPANLPCSWGRAGWFSAVLLFPSPPTFLRAEASLVGDIIDTCFFFSAPFFPCTALRPLHQPCKGEGSTLLCRPVVMCRLLFSFPRLPPPRQFNFPPDLSSGCSMPITLGTNQKTV